VRTTLAAGGVTDFLAWSPDSLAVLLGMRGTTGDLDGVVSRRLDNAGTASPLASLTVTRFQPGGGAISLRPRAADWQR